MSEQQQLEATQQQQGDAVELQQGLTSEQQQYKPIPTPSGEHPLQSAWSVWYDRKPKVQVSPDAPYDYKATLVKLGTVNTVEQFWRLYSYLQRPSQVPKNSSYHLFRNEALPMWESFPNGGCWMVKLKKNSLVLDRLWEQLIFSTLGEELGAVSASVVGVVVSLRSKEDILSIYHADTSNNAIKFRIGELFKEILHLGANTLIEYKSNINAIHDLSTFRNSKQYVVSDENESNATPQKRQQPNVAKKYKKKQPTPHKTQGQNPQSQSQNQQQQDNVDATKAPQQKGAQGRRGSKPEYQKKHPQKVTNQDKVVSDTSTVQPQPQQQQ